MRRTDLALGLDVLTGLAAEMFLTMLRDPAHRMPDHMRYRVHGPLDWRLQCEGTGAAVYAATYLALWERIEKDAMSSPEALIVWYAAARTIQRAERYWPRETCRMMVPSIREALIDEVPLPPLLQGVFLVALCHVNGDGEGDVEHMTHVLASQFEDAHQNRPAWRHVLRRATAGTVRASQLRPLSPDETERSREELRTIPRWGGGSPFDDWGDAPNFPHA